jgi:hypothetical protein
MLKDKFHAWPAIDTIVLMMLIIKINKSCRVTKIKTVMRVS